MFKNSGKESALASKQVKFFSTTIIINYYYICDKLAKAKQALPAHIYKSERFYMASVHVRPEKITKRATKLVVLQVLG